MYSCKFHVRNPVLMGLLGLHAMSPRLVGCLTRGFSASQKSMRTDWNSPSRRTQSSGPTTPLQFFLSPKTNPLTVEGNALLA
jgi:hypothetical protein